MDGYSMDKIIRIYDDKDGEYIEVRPSSDGLQDCFEIKDNHNTTIYFTKKEIPLLIKALEEMKTAQTL